MLSKSPQSDILSHRKPRHLRSIGLIALIGAVAVAAGGIAIRFYNDRQTAEWTDAQTIQSVQLLTLKGTKGGELTLPGNIQAFSNAPIFAQVAGTIGKWYYDIGASVKQGDLLAQIDSRSYQAALNQTKGQLARDSATLANAKVDLGRYETLAAQNAISAQQLSAQKTAVAADAGIVQTDEANVQTATINLGYTRITAPFDGILTSRSVDIGNFVTVGTATSTPLFTVTDKTKLRLYVNVPQSYSSLLKPGLTARFLVPEYPGRDFTASLSAASGAVSTQSGSQLVQFAFDNKANLLKSGAYAEVHLKLPTQKNTIRLPATALLFRDSGMVVATVDGTGHVKLKPIHIGTDTGNCVDIDAGLTSKDRVIDNPADSIQDGDAVKISTNNS